MMVSVETGRPRSLLPEAAMASPAGGQTPIRPPPQHRVGTGPQSRGSGPGVGLHRASPSPPLLSRASSAECGPLRPGHGQTLLAFHLHHVHGDLLLPHPENLKVGDNALSKRETGVSSSVRVLASQTEAVSHCPVGPRLLPGDSRLARLRLQRPEGDFGELLVLGQVMAGHSQEQPPELQGAESWPLAPDCQPHAGQDHPL